MKLKIIFFVVLACVVEALSQPRTQQEENVVSQRGSLQILPLYQRWTLDNAAFSQASSVLSLYQPVMRDANVSMRGSFGSASGDITSLSGLADVQLSGNYYLESANLVFSLGVGIPSGKKKLTPTEFLTSMLLTNNVFRLQVPHFGTGFNFAPGLVWAIPVNDDFVLGLGATYQYRGSFSPLEGFGSYDPGDEVSGTVGLDIRIDETSSLSADVIYTYYNKDKVDGLQIFAPGGKVLAALQYKKYFNLDELFFLVTFRTKAKADIAIGNLLQPLNTRVEPNQGEVLAAYTVHFNKQIAMQFLVEGRFFQQTTAPLSGFNLFGIGIMPEFFLSESVAIPLRIKYVYGKSKTNGKLSGIEAGLGVVVQY